jgi:predicted CXXCH cytochrome family protein
METGRARGLRRGRRGAWLLAAAFALGGGVATAGPHDPCATCHVTETDPALKEPEPGLCIGCHQERAAQGEHVIDVPLSSGQTTTLPLRTGLMTCITCHDEHAPVGAGMLRQTLGDLCSDCHRF